LMQKNCLPGINKKPLYRFLYMFRILKANIPRAKPTTPPPKI